MRNAKQASCCGFEQIEPRLMLTATAGLVSVWTDATIMGVVVDYSGIDPNTISAGDVAFTKAGGNRVVSTAVRDIENRPNNVIRVTYGIVAPDGAWGVTDTGSYTISSPPGEVQDPEQNALPFENLGQVWLWFATPKARMTSQTIGSSDWQVVMQYDSLDGMDESTIDGNDLVVAGGTPAGQSVVSITHLSATSTQVVYSILAPHGPWSFADTGTYSISLADGQVADMSARSPTARMLGQFYLWFGSPSAHTELTTVGTTDWMIPVTFTPAPGQAINAASLVGDGAITVSGVKGYFEQGHMLTLLHNSDGSYTATYRVPGNGGSWDWTDNGDYTVNIPAGRVRDTSGNYMNAGPIGLFHLWFTTPAAQLELPVHPTSTQWDFTVEFSDNDAIDTSSINTASVRVQGPDGGVIPVALISTFLSDGVEHATFRLSAPGGLENGAYSVWANGDGARDMQGNSIAEAQLASFWFWF